MSLSSQHQSHMNIVDSRKAAVKWLAANTGRQIFVAGNRVAKGRVLTSIKRGLLDGYYYSLNVHMDNVDIVIIDFIPHNPCGYRIPKIGH